MYPMPQPVRGPGRPDHEHERENPHRWSTRPRKEGVDKLLGRARYVDDIEREGMCFGATVRSTIPRGIIRSIGYGCGIDWSEFTIVTAADIPGKNHIHIIFADQPALPTESSTTATRPLCCWRILTNTSCARPCLRSKSSMSRFRGLHH